jgi:hypothetical protein
MDHRVKPGDDDHYESRCQHAATDFNEPDSGVACPGHPHFFAWCPAPIARSECVDARIKSGHDDSLKHVFASKHWPNDGYMIAQIINFKMLIIAK